MGSTAVIIVVAAGLLWLLFTVVIPSIMRVVPKLIFFGIGLLLIFAWLDSIGITPIALASMLGFNPGIAFIVIIVVILLLAML